MNSEKTLIFTVDVETHNPDIKDNGALWIAGLLKEYGAKGTFFITAQEIQKVPHMAEKLLNQGHEVASHGYSHRGEERGYKIPYLDQLNDARTRREIEESYKCFEGAGFAVKGYRAPALRIRPEQLKIIGEYFEYDSSWNYRKNGEYRGQYSEFIKELPVSRFKPLPVLAGSPYVFLWGVNFWKVFEKVSKLTTPVVFYCHSFDVVKEGAAHHPNLGLFRKMIYYQHCGQKAKIYLKSLLGYFVKNDWQVQSCEQFIT